MFFDGKQTKVHFGSKCQESSPSSHCEADHGPAQLAFETVFMTAASKNVFVRVYGAILITYLIELKTLEPVHTQLALI